MTINRISLMLLWCLSVIAVIRNGWAEDTSSAPTSGVRFEKLTLTDQYYCDGIAAGDIDRDGQMDVVAGPFWYRGPDFRDAQAFYPAESLIPERSPSNSMFSFVYDFNADGWQDILVLGRVHKHPARWFENPAGGEGLWKEHLAFERVRGESPTFVDVDGDQRPELLTHWEGRWGWLRPTWKQADRPFTFAPLEAMGEWPEFYHGQGTGDVNGDGRLDVLINDGWYEQPVGAQAIWPFHQGKFSEARGGAQMFVDDVDRDGDADVISVLDAHGWGLAWFEQRNADSASQDPVRVIGQRAFVQHTIMGSREQEATYGAAFSQPHALEMADIDGDGHRDIVCGKRMWAHGPTGDVEPAAAPVVVWFQWTQTGDGEIRYVPHLIDDRSGVGVQIAIADVNGDKRPDVLAASKLGTFVFLNHRGT